VFERCKVSINCGKGFLFGEKLRLVRLYGPGREALKLTIPEGFSQLVDKPLFALECSLPCRPGEIRFRKLQKRMHGESFDRKRILSLPHLFFSLNQQRFRNSK
jgi:hypothetical protein